MSSAALSTLRLFVIVMLSSLRKGDRLAVKALRSRLTSN
jgi:hypothetical protein